MPLFDQTPSEGTARHLALLDRVLAIAENDATWPDFFAAVTAVIACDRAVVVQDTGDGLAAIAAYPGIENAQTWPMLSLADATQVATFVSAEDNAPDDSALATIAGAAGTAMSVPLCFGGAMVMLAVLRDDAGHSFSESDLKTARHCAAMALAAFAVERSNGLEQDANQARRDKDTAKENLQLMMEIIDHLPISLTVQDNDGRFILANAMAAATLAMPAEMLSGASPSDFLSGAEAESRREWEQIILRRGQTVAFESKVPDPHGEQTWLTSYTPTTVLDRRLLISSSVNITEHKTVERVLMERAHSDELTGLPDRIVFQEHVESLISSDGGNRQFALAFFDLDNFKHINDYYNHAVGDALLVKISERVKNLLRPNDMLARISGDEFLLLLDPHESKETTQALLDTVLASVKQPFQIEGFEVFSSCSIGVSVYPDHGTTFEVLSRNADSAMYRAKHNNKGNIVLFDQAVEHDINARMETEQRLRLAIRDRKFCCVYQPKVDIQTLEVTGVETLVRWRDDNGDIHPPGSFIQLAIELGLINPITHFVLNDAINAFDRIDAAFGTHCHVSINVGAQQANDLDFMTSFVQTVKDSGRAERIIVELTEEAIVAKSVFQEKILPMLRDLGIRVSIDDFGTGFSSLSQLADITADEIKIDRSFISGIHKRPRNQSVLKAIESLGHALDMTIIAEGVETFEELAYLQAATRIRYAQGFYFAKPLYLDEIAEGAHSLGRAAEAARADGPQRVMTGRLTAPSR